MVVVSSVAVGRESARSMRAQKGVFASTLVREGTSSLAGALGAARSGEKESQRSKGGAFEPIFLVDLAQRPIARDRPRSFARCEAKTCGPASWPEPRSARRWDLADHCRLVF